MENDQKILGSKCEEGNINNRLKSTLGKDQVS